MEFGDNCFGKGGGESTSAETGAAVKVSHMETTAGHADVRKIIVDPGTNCWFESYGDFFISGDEHLEIKYIPYKGYASQIALYGEEKSCKFQEMFDLKTGKADMWFKTNSFGGACGYMVTIGLSMDHEEGATEAILTRKHENNAMKSMSAMVGLISSFIYFLN